MMGQEMRGCGAFVPLQWSGGWEDADRLFHGNGAEDGWYRSVCTKESEWRMGGNRSFAQRRRSDGWEITNP